MEDLSPSKDKRDVIIDMSLSSEVSFTSHVSMTLYSNACEKQIYIKIAYQTIILRFCFFVLFLYQDNIQNPMSQGNIPLVSRSSTPQQNSFTADVLDHDKNEVEDNSFTTQQLFSFAWQIARGMVLKKIITLIINTSLVGIC